MSRYLDPKSDIVFKRIFGEHPKLLISFLNAVLPLPEQQQIKSLSYLSPEQVPTLPIFKSTIVDVKCTDQEGRTFIVEMQIQWLSDFMKRMLYNTTSAYARQLHKGEKFNELSPVYGLALLADTFTDKPEFYHHYKMTKVDEPNHCMEDIQLIFIELPKFQPNTFSERKLAALWLRFLSEISENTLRVDPALLDEPDIREALELTETAAYSPGELYAYEAYWDAVRVEKSREDDSFTRGEEKGLEQGLEKGLEQGLEQGLKQGIKQGREEEKYEFVKNSLREGLDIEIIAKITQMPLEIIREIQEELKRTE